MPGQDFLVKYKELALAEPKVAEFQVIQVKGVHIQRLEWYNMTLHFLILSVTDQLNCKNVVGNFRDIECF